MRGPGGQIHNFGYLPGLLARSISRDVEDHFQSMQEGKPSDHFGFASHANGGAGNIQLGGRGGEEPMLQLLHQALVFLGLFDFREASWVGVGLQFRRHRPVETHEKDGCFLETFLPPGRDQALPPFLGTEILAGERKLLEIILQQQPRSLRIVAIGENLQDFGPFGHSRLGIGQFAAQIRLRPVGFAQDMMVGVVLGSITRSRWRVGFARTLGHW